MDQPHLLPHASHHLLQPLPEVGKCAGIIDEKDLGEQVGWRPVDHGVDRSDQSRPGFVVEDDDHLCNVGYLQQLDKNSAGQDQDQVLERDRVSETHI